jgi:hypothetical protein
MMETILNYWMSGGWTMIAILPVYASYITKCKALITDLRVNPTDQRATAFWGITPHSFR